ncbi:hypothetical protein CY34DRAFT_798168 [Suillus luteus UH-Slu-Lm8-n1]|uniref:Uncharacterized protein n=1 Tax=Suillus luteus UH-Slu-Lm8-n1 TaxID=930992 RepID=A0A0D0B2V2_9AGAM|nr:hypothetical protein CY34DRAFT_798168 [Suillus luteus UH-Slu-Lm8-n1]
MSRRELDVKDMQADISGCGRLWMKSRELRYAGDEIIVPDRRVMIPCQCQTFPVMIYTDWHSASHREYVYGLCREPGAGEVDLERPSKLNLARIVDQRDQRKSVCSLVVRP